MANAPLPNSVAIPLQYGADAGLYIQRSQYLADALRNLQESSQNNIRTPGALLGNLGAAALLQAGQKKANTSALGAIQSQQAAQAAQLATMLGGNPAQPSIQTPSPASAVGPITPSTGASQAAPTLAAPQISMDPHRSDGSSPIGIRQNNPGNIRQTDIPWLGKTAPQGGFESFDSPQDGIRALARNLMTYGSKGINTAQGIAGRWAPPSENNTPAYAQALAGALGNGPLNLKDPATLAKAAGAIIQHENGSNPYSPDMINGGVSAALGMAPQAPQMAPPQAPAPQIAQPAPQAPQPAAASLPAASGPPGGTPSGVTATPEQIKMFRYLMSNPQTHDQGVAYAMDILKKNAEPTKYDIQTVGGVPVAIDPYHPDRQIVGQVPQAAMSHIQDAAQLGIQAPGGTTFNVSPLGVATSAYTPPQNFEYKQGALQAIKGGAADPTAPNNAIPNEEKLRDDYTKDITDYVGARNGYQKVLASAKDNTGASDIALIFGFMKTLDPNSTVREGEFATAQNSGSISDTVMNMYNKALKGERLQPEQRQSFAHTAGQQFKVYQDRADQVNQRYGDMASRYGLDPRNVVQQFEPLQGPAEKGPAGAKQGPDGNWYYQDPHNPRSFPQAKQGNDGAWYIPDSSRASKFLRLD